MNRLALVVALAVPSLALAGGAPAMTVESALTEAEQRLDAGGNAADIAVKLHHTHGLAREELRRLELIDARDDLLAGSFASAEKALAKFHKAAPDDARIAEWYARALHGSGKDDLALPMFKGLAAKDALHDGDSYWTLAQLERKTEPALALEHARAAQTHPILFQSDELDKEIAQFIAELSKGK